MAEMSEIKIVGSTEINVSNAAISIGLGHVRCPEVSGYLCHMGSN
jgi:hypothetical protein